MILSVLLLALVAHDVWLVTSDCACFYLFHCSIQRRGYVLMGACIPSRSFYRPCRKLHVIFLARFSPGKYNCQLVKSRGTTAVGLGSALVQPITLQ